MTTTGDLAKQRLHHQIPPAITFYTHIMFPMTPAENKITIASVGYERRTAEDLLGLLKANNVTALVDVRLTPISRKKGLSKTALAVSQTL